MSSTTKRAGASPDEPARRVARRLPVGVEPLGGDVAHVRVWAPAAERVDIVLEGRHDPNGGGSFTDPDPAHASLESEPGGYHAARVERLGPGALYRFSLDGSEPLPDPASRWQPFGVFGPSCVVDPRAFAWTDDRWTGTGIRGRVIEEIHVGTFTPEGTWAAAAERLPDLVDVGIDAVEVMPVAEFPGDFGWGYDGADLWAPTRLYGSPDDMRRFIDRAHSLGLAVILDVVYNHLGPSGNYLGRFARAYFTDRYTNEWGEALNFDGPDSAPVREFFLANAQHWIAEYHLDGLRLDATQQIFDASGDHIIAAIARAARSAGGRRSVVVLGENEPQQAGLARPERDGGAGLDALWNDDFHHTTIVALTGRAEAYYSDYGGTPQELISAAKWGFLYQGQRYAWQDQPRGSPALDLPAHALVNFLENHDQVANSPAGERLATRVDAASRRALTALLLLGPGTPMLFQGQEFGSTAPFLYFADHEPALAESVQHGRAQFLSQFTSIAAPELRVKLADPASRDTFLRSRLDWSERERHAPTVALHRDLISLRRTDPAFAAQDAGRMHGAVIGPRALALRWICGGDDDRLLLINLERDLAIDSAPEPLLAPPERTGWRLLWSSEAPPYGGSGQPEVYAPDRGFRLPGRSAVVLAPERRAEDSPRRPARVRRAWTQQ